MSYGLVGAHRVGKTTLAHHMTQATDCSLLLTDVGSVWDAHGLDPSEPIPFGQRIAIQNDILDHCEALWYGEVNHFFTDRTPIDMMAYTMADIAGHMALTERELQQFRAYQARCFRSTHRFFGTLFLIQPGIKLADPGDKPCARMDMAYMEHLNTLMNGLMYSTACKTSSYVMPRSKVDLKARVNWLLASLDHAYDDQKERTAFATMH